MKNASPLPSHYSKQRIIAAIVEAMRERGLLSVPLDARVEYSYIDDHEVNDGDVGWLVIDQAGRLCGLDEDMEIAMERFTKAALQDVFRSIRWANGRADRQERE